MILNLTQHNSTPEQIEQLVFEPKNKRKVQEFLTFNELPTRRDIFLRSAKLVDIVLEEKKEIQFFDVMIGGALFLMSTLEHDLLNNNFTPVYSFSKRITSEIINRNKEIEKISIFKHIGFISIPKKNSF